jgi:hypothetical protein
MLSYADRYVRWYEHQNDLSLSLSTHSNLLQYDGEDVAIKIVPSPERKTSNDLDTSGSLTYVSSGIEAAGPFIACGSIFIQHRRSTRKDVSR